MHEASFTSIDDLTDSQVKDVLELADEYERNGAAYAGKGNGLIMGSIFLEPSTRTRGSFESAMLRLGGNVISVTDAASSSIKKGETLADTARIWSGYCDLIVLRHPWEGAAAAFAEFADVPVINAGDGGNEHPTQTLVDLFTLKKEYGKLDGLSMAICGDLRLNRAVHSLIFALLRFGMDSYLVAPKGFGLPDHVENRIRRTYGVDVQAGDPAPFASLFESGGVDGKSGQSNDTEEVGLDALYVTSTDSHQLTMERSIRRAERRASLLDEDILTLYLTRRQREREQVEEAGSSPYPRVTPDVLRRRAFRQAIVMHPLPRVDEVAQEVDEDDRSRYFQQARYGVPVRQALIALITGRKKWSEAADSLPGKKVASGVGEIACSNAACVFVREPSSASREFFIDLVDKTPGVTCRYCGREVSAAWFRRGEHGTVRRHISKITESDVKGDKKLSLYSTLEDAIADGLKPGAGRDGPSVEYISGREGVSSRA